MKLDILAFGAHPDDIELSCSATLAKHIAEGKKVGAIDLTRGELGTRGSAEIRDQEAKEASRILGLSIRENLQFRDGFFENKEDHQLEVIKMIRKYQPEIVIANAKHDRHPDHARASELVRESCFLAGLTKIKTKYEGEYQEAYRPKNLYFYLQYYFIQPDLVIDTTEYMDKKLESILAYKTQFYDPNSTEPETPISSQSFLDSIRSRDQELGRLIQRPYAEGFTVERAICANSLFDLK